MMILNIYCFNKKYLKRANEAVELHLTPSKDRQLFQCFAMLGSFILDSGLQPGYMEYKTWSYSNRNPSFSRRKSEKIIFESEKNVNLEYKPLVIYSR